MRRTQLLDASTVARFFQVDLKTVHNWVDNGTLVAARTPGRHLRFTPSAVLSNMRKYFLPDMIPDELIAMAATAATDEKDTYTAAVAVLSFLEKRSIPVPEELRALIQGMTPPDDVAVAKKTTEQLKS